MFLNSMNLMRGASFRVPIQVPYTVVVPDQCTIRSSNGICLLGYVPGYTYTGYNLVLFPQ